jgi:hypothetical protein
MASGLTHTADSLAGGKRGTFIDRFGPPGDPAVKARTSGDHAIVGDAPSLLKTGLGGGRGKGKR